MRDITDLMDHYRDVARSVWNTGFWVQADLQTWDARDQFEQIKKLLFKALVVARLEEGHCCDLYGLADNQIYQVVPNHSEYVPIMIQRPRQGAQTGYWDDPVRQVKASEADLQFLDYFDWNNMGYADFQYYRVRIATFATQPHLVGREALLDHLYAKVFADTSSGVSPSAA
ncbi:MAG: hypothetical protein ABSG32_12880 [Terriglobia bacterium]|jgi:hypothetical protein